MEVKLRFFALFKNLAGTEYLVWQVKEGTKLGELKQEMEHAFPGFKNHPAIIAVGGEYKKEDYILKEGDEVNILPPFSGGAVELTNQPILPQEIIEQVKKPAFGAIASFLGTVRDSSEGRKVLYLEYEAHPELTKKSLEQIVAEAKARWSVGEVAFVHRLGKVNVGEVAVAIAVSSVHRREALEACAYLIERLKQAAPIWKKEVFEDGEAWVSGK